MKVFVLLFLVGASSAVPTAPMYSMELVDEHFEKFMQTYEKQYESEVEKTKRLEIFKQNLALINHKNKHSDSAVFGINMFTDLTTKEFIEKHTGLRGGIRDVSSCQPGSINSTAAPESWDWNAQGVVSPVKDQGNCRSCWAFSAIGNVESHYAMINKQILDLAEQQLVDCDKQSSGCDGTQDIEYPFAYLTGSGAMQEQDYPYQAAAGTCKFDAQKVQVKVQNCMSHTPASEEELTNVLYSAGPLSLGVDSSDLHNYVSGVLKSCSFSQLNHAVLLVGYGTENGTPYWLIKNSWGPSFGEQGFFKIQRGVNACGIMTSKMMHAVVG